jgi:hypothetical protein
VQGDVAVGPTVDDLVAALKANTSYTSSAASPVTVGGFDGQEIELQLPGADVIAACDRRPGESTGDYLVFPKGFYAQGPNSRWHLYIVDVDGTRLITMVSIAEGTPPGRHRSRGGHRRIVRVHAVIRPKLSLNAYIRRHDRRRHQPAAFTSRTRCARLDLRRRSGGRLLVEEEAPGAVAMEVDARHRSLVRRLT